MLVKSMCKRSTGVVDTIGCRGAFGKLLLMLQATHAGFYGLLHPVGHSLPSEEFLQQAQGMVVPLMTCILVAPIQSGDNIVCLGDHEEQADLHFHLLGVKHRYKAS